MLLAGTLMALALLTMKLSDACHVVLTVGHIVEADGQKNRKYAAELGLDPAAARDPVAGRVAVSPRREAVSVTAAHSGSRAGR